MYIILVNFINTYIFFITIYDSGQLNITMPHFLRSSTFRKKKSIILPVVRISRDNQVIFIEISLYAF